MKYRGNERTVEKVFAFQMVEFIISICAKIGLKMAFYDSMCMNVK